MMVKVAEPFVRALNRMLKVKINNEEQTKILPRSYPHPLKVKVKDAEYIESHNKGLSKSVYKKDPHLILLNKSCSFKNLSRNWLETGKFGQTFTLSSEKFTLSSLRPRKGQKESWIS